MSKYVLAVDAAEIISQKMNIPLADLVDVFAQIPTADVEPVRRGEWVDSDKYKGWQECSFCHGCYVDEDWVDGKKWSFCPNCGARMGIEGEENKEGR